MMRVKRPAEMQMKSFSPKPASSALVVLLFNHFALYALQAHRSNVTAFNPFEYNLAHPHASNADVSAEHVHTN